MTKEKVARLYDSNKDSELYKKSTSLYKDIQGLEWHKGGLNAPLLKGIGYKVEVIDGEETQVILHFDDNGQLHGTEETIQMPSVEYRGHIEYWEHGFIIKVLDKKTRTVEHWKNGNILSIEVDSPEGWTREDW